ncbi:unnamed protein product [Durusdinium trenchii]|uniref:Kinesin-like protein n=1 Tax=Durusdinium trenchii TaxID=1381693 RepID=A0ABP0SB82_9DINO
MDYKVYKLRVRGSYNNLCAKLGQELRQQLCQQHLQRIRLQESESDDVLQQLVEELHAHLSPVQMQLYDVCRGMNFQSFSCTPSWARGAHIFVNSALAGEIEDAFEGVNLGKSDVIVSPEHLELVLDALAEGSGCRQSCAYVHEPSTTQHSLATFSAFDAQMARDSLNALKVFQDSADIDEVFERTDARPNLKSSATFKVYVCDHLKRWQREILIPYLALVPLEAKLASMDDEHNESTLKDVYKELKMVTWEVSNAESLRLFLMAGNPHEDTPDALVEAFDESMNILSTNIAAAINSDLKGMLRTKWRQWKKSYGKSHDAGCHAAAEELRKAVCDVMAAAWSAINIESMASTAWQRQNEAHRQLQKSTAQGNEETGADAMANQKDKKGPKGKFKKHQRALDRKAAKIMNRVGESSVSVENLFVFECRTPGEALNYYKARTSDGCPSLQYRMHVGPCEAGVKNRTVASHQMNQASSRSHSVLTLTIERRSDHSVDRVSKLTLVDLAGSERQAITGASGRTLQESVGINQSLFVLRKVIMCLAKRKGNKLLVPYRESKLTILLRDAIGGSGYTLMLACLSILDSNFEENVSTLQYACTAGSIRNRPVVNLDPTTLLIRQLRREVQFLKGQLSLAENYVLRVTGKPIPREVLQGDLTHVPEFVFDVGESSQRVQHQQNRTPRRANDDVKVTPSKMPPAASPPPDSVAHPEDKERSETPSTPPDASTAPASASGAAEPRPWGGPSGEIWAERLSEAVAALQVATSETWQCQGQSY